MISRASSAFRLAARKLSIFPADLYRSDSVITRLSSRSARSGWSSGVAESASSTFTMAACRLSIFPVHLYQTDRIVARLFSRPARSG